MENKHIKMLKDIIFILLILTASTLLGMLFRYWGFHETNVVVIYIFSVQLIACFTRGYFYGIISSVISLLLFNWFFTAPYYTFKVYDMTYLITFTIMTITSILTSTLTSKVKQAASDAIERENESNALYLMTNNLTDAEDEEVIAQIIVKTTSNILNTNVSYLFVSESGRIEKTFIQQRDDGQILRRKHNQNDELLGRLNHLKTSAEIIDNDYYYPIYGKTSLLGVLKIHSDIASNMSASQIRMLYSIIESSSLALDRLRSIQAQTKSQEETAHERYRGNLLRAISHDIRTPLSGIMGTSEMIMDKTDESDTRYMLAKDIYKETQWLHGLVENILNLTKLQDGKLSLIKQSEAVEEVIGAALMAMEKRLPERVIEVEMPDNVVMVPMDASLISQVLINLLDNASKHTSSDEEIKITVETDKDNVYISVKDRGCGIPEKDLSNIFQMFYTVSKSADSRRGVGLGLAICQTIVEAHGGEIKAKNRNGGGTEFIFTLPFKGE